MEYFNVHFFKEKTREKDIKAIIAFFEAIEGFESQSDEDSLRFIYTHPKLGYQARFLIMPKSQVAEIHRIDPRYLDINFHVELPILSPDFFARHVFLIAKKLADKFDYFIFQTYFEDVLPFDKIELLMKIFNIVKEKYLEMNPRLLEKYNLVPKDKLSAILRYIDDSLELHKYYQELNTYVPLYHCLLNEAREVKLAIEWKDNTLTVLPPYLDYIFFNHNNVIKIIKYDEAVEQIERHLKEVPGFLRNTLVTTKKGQRRALKIMRRYKFSKVTDRFEKVDVKTLLD